MKEICESAFCTGCAACFNACAQSAIQMEEDERGFLYPGINQSICVDCGICQQICPQVRREAPTQEGTIYAALAIDDCIRGDSSSGGIFSLLARSVLQEGGVVYGASFERNMHVQHIEVDMLDDLEKLRGSKYVQSETGRIYSAVKDNLVKNKSVLFSGTPCQVDALRCFLGKDYDKLLTVDILCHGVPSPHVLMKFIESKEQSVGKKTVSINFREKNPGWKDFSLSLTYSDGSTEVDNSYYYFFVRNYCLRESCSSCLYSSIKRVGDITLGDFWGYKETGPEHIENDDLGISLLSVNTPKGERAFKRIKKELDCARREPIEAVKGNPVLEHPCSPHERAGEFWEDFPSLSWDELVEKYSIPREKKWDRMSKEDREYYSRPYKQRHFRHALACKKNNILKKLGRKE